MADSQVQGRAKRQKVCVACEPCRARKTKCDGRPPVCGPCQRRGNDSNVCEWVHAFLSRDGSEEAEYIRHLESRLKAMEEHQASAFAATKDRGPTEPVSRLVGRDPSDLPADIGRKGLVEEEEEESIDPTWVAEAQNPSFHAQESLTSPDLPTLATLGSPAESSLLIKYRWSSSALSFMSHVHKMAGKQKEEAGGEESRIPLYPKPGCSDGHASSEAELYVLPPRKMVDGQLKTYWKYVHTLFPVIAKRVTMAEFQSVWTADGTIVHEKSFHCLLNIMLALASMFQPINASPKDRTASAEAYFRRARGLFDHSHSANLRNVQICLLFGLYLQSSDELHDCWMYVGLAIRIAQGLGLYLAETSACHYNDRERVLFRRVWYGCVLLDRNLAMVSGRPCTIHRTEALAVERPTPVHGECFPSEPYQSPDIRQLEEKPSIVHFFNSTLSLYDILYDILRAFYTETRSAPELLHQAYGQYFGESAKLSIPSLDDRLSAWERAQPSFLKVESQSPDHGATDLSRQSVILRQRFLHVRILSLRPAMSALIVHHTRETSNEAGSLRTKVVIASFVQSSVSCFRAAEEAIAIVYSRRSEDAELSPWWENVLFVYTAMTCVMAARIQLSLFPEITMAAINEALQQAFTVLQKYTACSSSVGDMVRSLQILYDFVRSRPVHDGGNGKCQAENGALPEVIVGDAPLLNMGNTICGGMDYPDFANLLMGYTMIPMQTSDTPLWDGDDSWLDLSPFRA